jgi:glycosyltransferase involved in cell wall biosynthesis
MHQIPIPSHVSDETNGKLFGRVMLCVTEDWFALSHFRPLISLLVRLAGEVLVVTRSSGRLHEIEALGASTLNFEYHRSSLNPGRELQSARRLAAVIADFRPEALHLIAMKPIVLGGLAVRLKSVSHVVLHVTGLGFLGITETAKVRLVRWIVFKHISAMLARPGSWLLVENEEDLAYLEEAGANARGRHTILGGAGIDPDQYELQAEPDGELCHAAYIGRMIHPKGVDVLMAASRVLAQRGVPLTIDLYGQADADNPEAIEPANLKDWSAEGHGCWHGPTRDVIGVWKQSDIFVLPARSREGLPRALLEAAACGRAAVVTDVPGCRSFVRHGIEGLIVPPENAEALADALETLARDPALRRRLGLAARARVIDGYTIAQVVSDLERSYVAIAQKA